MNTERIALVAVDSPNYGDVVKVYANTDSGFSTAQVDRKRINFSYKIVELDDDLDGDVAPGGRMRVTGRRKF